MKIRRAIPKGDLAFTNATLITMKGKGNSNGTILIKNNRMLKIGKSENIVLPEGVKIIDVKGKFILPGFVDTRYVLAVLGIT